MTAAAGAAEASKALVGEPSAGPEVAIALALVVAVGLVEGIALGTAQVSVLGRRLPGVRRGRWVLVTVAVAGGGWAAGSAPAVLAGDDGRGGGAPLALIIPASALIGALLGAALGTAQALVLRGRVGRPWRWVSANALAWPLPMAVIFLGATAPSADWPVPAVLGLGAATGLAAGTVFGLISGRFLPSLQDGSSWDAGIRGT